MKVFNLTDIETPRLREAGFVGHTFVVLNKLIGPGQSADIPPEKVASVREGLQRLVGVGALSVGDQPPPAYLVAKSHKKPAGG